MIEVRLEPDQKVRSLLCSTVAFLSLRGEECLIRISREGGRVQRERRACHDEFGEGIQQFRTGEHALLHARVKKVDVITQQLVDRGHF